MSAAKILTLAGAGNTTISGVIEDFSGGIGTAPDALTITNSGTTILSGNNTYQGADSAHRRRHARSQRHAQRHEHHGQQCGGRFQRGQHGSHHGRHGRQLHAQRRLGIPVRRQQLRRRDHGQRRHLAVGRQQRAAEHRAAVNGTGLLDLNQNSAAVDSLSGSGTIASLAQGTPTLTIGNANGSGTFAGVISGPIALTKAGSGAEILSGSNSYTGGTSVSAGTLQIGNGTSGEFLASPTISNSARWSSTMPTRSAMAATSAAAAA